MSENIAYFDVLTPVHFISRAAAVYDDKIAVIYESVDLKAISVWLDFVGTKYGD